jgi:hypothetical protein
VCGCKRFRGGGGVGGERRPSCLCMCLCMPDGRINAWLLRAETGPHAWMGRACRPGPAAGATKSEVEMT